MSFNQLPPELERKVKALENLYGKSQTQLEAAIMSYGFDDLTKLQSDMNAVIDHLDAQTAAWVSDSVWRIVLFETRRAERLIRGPKLTISAEVMKTINQGFYVTFAQQNAQIRDNLTAVLNKGYVRGASLQDRRAFQQAVINQGIQGIVRSDGSTLSVRATGKALVRTRVEQLANESHMARYRAGGIKMIDVLAEDGECRATPSCQSYAEDGPYAVDEVPLPPYHLYCRCRVVPVVK